VATSRIPGLVLTDHELAVPLDHSDPGGEQITLYAREVVSPGHEHDDLPWLVFLQGGPGGKSPRLSDPIGWEGALERFRVLLLDQRGTGRSTPANRQTLAARGGAAAIAAYLRHFRADAIVRDCELLRRKLAGTDARWSLLCQSYGGFCALTYLSLAPEALREVLIAGGLPSLDRLAEHVYLTTFPKALARSQAYYRRYPDDVARVAEIADHLAARTVRLPSGDALTVERLQAMGMPFGMADGYERLHYLVEEAWVDGAVGRELSDSFLRGVEDETSFATNPLYAALQEPIYAQGTATRWAAQRVRARFPAFAPDARPLAFTGEMIFPWMFEVDQALQPLAEASDLLAHVEDWPALYDVARLAANEVPVAAAVYHDDLYVAVELSLETAARVGNLRAWVTNEYEHDGLRRSEGKVFARLLGMVRGDV
jgi:pimeloyl-ACP methyl ester carboxylesterase